MSLKEYALGVGLDGLWSGDVQCRNLDMIFKTESLGNCLVMDWSLCVNWIFQWIFWLESMTLEWIVAGTYLSSIRIRSGYDLKHEGIGISVGTWSIGVLLGVKGS